MNALQEKNNQHMNEYQELLEEKLALCSRDKRFYVAKQRAEMKMNFPEGNAAGLARKCPKLYVRMQNTSKKINMRMEDYIRALGFEYRGMHRGFDEESVKNALMEYYPEKKIVDFQSKDLKLYLQMKELAKEEQMSMKVLAKKWGFQYERGRMTQLEKKEAGETVKEKIKKIANEKKEVHSKNLTPKLKQEMYYQSRKLGETMQEYLQGMGYVYISSKRGRKLKR